MFKSSRDEIQMFGSLIVKKIWMDRIFKIRSTYEGP